MPPTVQVDSRRDFETIRTVGINQVKFLGVKEVIMLSIFLLQGSMSRADLLFHCVSVYCESSIIVTPCYGSGCHADQL